MTLAKLESLQGCKLRIGSYPFFNYDASSGGGKASLVKQENLKTRNIVFDPETFIIPSLSWRNTRISFLPMPPGLEIKMFLDKLEGFISIETGYICLDFEARFSFSIFSVIRFPFLNVKTVLSTKEVNGKLKNYSGKPIDKNSRCKLVGVADIPKTGDKFLDIFLGLPNEALAILECNLVIIENQ